MKCDSCRATIDDDSLFCSRCGIRMSTPAARTVPDRPTPARQGLPGAIRRGFHLVRRRPVVLLAAGVFLGMGLVTLIVVLGTGSASHAPALGAITRAKQLQKRGHHRAVLEALARDGQAPGGGEARRLYVASTEALAREGDTAAWSAAVAMRQGELALLPGDLEALRGLAELHALRGDVHVVAGLLDAALVHAHRLSRDEAADLLNDAATAHAASGDVPRAEVLLADALQRAPDHARALANRGILHLEAGRHEAARVDLTAALAREPGLAPARTALADALWQTGRLDEARAEAERVLAETPGYGPALNLQGIMAEDAGDREAASRFYQAARGVLRSEGIVQENLARVQRPVKAASGGVAGAGGAER